MNRKKYLQRILDTVLKPEIKQLFGEKSYIRVSNISHLRRSDQYVVSVTLYIDNVEESMIFYPDGLEVIVNKGWIAVGDGKPIAISSSIESI
jgi:hypothetical protein